MDIEVEVEFPDGARMWPAYREITHRTLLGGRPAKPIVELKPIGSPEWLFTCGITGKWRALRQ